MKAQTAQTFLVYYKPYQHRSECCAVGVLVKFENGTVRIHAGSNLKKVQAIDPSCSADVIRTYLSQIEDELNQRIDSLPFYQSIRAMIEVSPRAGQITFKDDDEYNAAIHWALAVSVDPSRVSNQDARAPVSRLYLELKGYFDTYGWMARHGQSIQDKRIVPRYPILADEGLIVDFALSNESHYYLQTIDFRHNAAHKRAEGTAKILTLGMAQQLSNTKTHRYAIIAGGSDASAKSSIKLAERICSNIFINESSADMNELLSTVAKAIGQPLLAPPSTLQ